MTSAARGARSVLDVLNNLAFRSPSPPVKPYPLLGGAPPDDWDWDEGQLPSDRGRVWLVADGLGSASFAVGNRLPFVTALQASFDQSTSRRVAPTLTGLSYVAPGRHYAPLHTADVVLVPPQSGGADPLPAEAYFASLQPGRRVSCIGFSLGATQFVMSIPKYLKGLGRAKIDSLILVQPAIRFRGGFSFNIDVDRVSSTMMYLFEDGKRFEDIFLRNIQTIKDNEIDVKILVYPSDKVMLYSKKIFALNNRYKDMVLALRCPALHGARAMHSHVSVYADDSMLAHVRACL